MWHDDQNRNVHKNHTNISDMKLKITSQRKKKPRHLIMNMNKILFFLHFFKIYLLKV